MLQLLVFAKAPELGKAKTRLIPALGEQGALDVARSLLEQTLINVSGCPGRVSFCVTPFSWPGWEALLPGSRVKVDQGSGDLGARITRCAQSAWSQGGGPMLVIGTDCPELTSERLQELVQALQEHDAAIIPALDGGYVALGMREFSTKVFANVAWSTEQVAQQTCNRFDQLGWSWRALAPLRDIDELHDLEVWRSANKGDGQ